MSIPNSLPFLMPTAIDPWLLEISHNQSNDHFNADSCGIDGAQQANKVSLLKEKELLSVILAHWKIMLTFLVNVMYMNFLMKTWTCYLLIFRDLNYNNLDEFPTAVRTLSNLKEL